MARAAASATISLGMISIPVKFFLAAASETFAFNMISPEGNRIRQQLVDEVTNQPVDRDATRRGYEVQKGEYVIFTDEEIESLLEEDKKNTVELAEFVPYTDFDPMAVEKSYYLHPDKGAEKSYLLLLNAMQQLEKMVIGKYFGRGKDNLIIIAPTDNYLTLFQMYYKNEVRAFEYQFSDKNNPSEAEVALATKLIEAMSSDTLNMGEYTDEFSERVRLAIDQKKAGNFTKTIAPKSNYVAMDLVALMEASLKAAKVEKPAKKVAKLKAVK